MTHPIAGAYSPPARPREDAPPQGLTPQQKPAVQHCPGPLLTIAGPGAGKTKTLIHRIARLLADRRRAALWEILAVTFSVRAAGELADRGSPTSSASTSRAGSPRPRFTPSAHESERRRLRFFGRTDSSTVYDDTDVRRVNRMAPVRLQQRRQVQQAQPPMMGYPPPS